MEEAEIKYPVLFEESMNTVLCQELVKYNRLISTVNSSLKSVRKAIKGLVVMSAELEQLANQLFFGIIPQMWLKKSYGSLKPLAGYFMDLLKRIEFFELWLKTAPPVVFWISGFFFTHAFTTGAKQNFARRYTIPIDAVEFDQLMLPKDQAGYTKKPKDGVYTYGLALPRGRAVEQEERGAGRAHAQGPLHARAPHVVRPHANQGDPAAQPLQLPRLQDLGPARHPRHHRPLDQLRLLHPDAHPRGRHAGALGDARRGHVDAARRLSGRSSKLLGWVVPKWLFQIKSPILGSVLQPI